MKKHYAIIGFGCAGYHAAKAIRSADAAGEIDIYSSHSEAPYNPMLTTYRTAGKIERDRMFPFGSAEDIRKELNVNVIADMPALRVLPDRSIVTTAGTTDPYDAVLISTGASAFVPPIDGIDGEEIYYMRTKDDSDRLFERLKRELPQKAVVVGAAFVGIKVVELLNNAGVDVTFVDMAPYLFPLSAYEDVAHMLEKRIAGRGVKLLFGRGLSSIADRDGKKVFRFSDGTEIEADLGVLCIGIRPNSQIVDPGEFRVNRGIVVDQRMETSVPGIYAAGDCCEGNDLQSDAPKMIGLWANAGNQGDVAGVNMAGGSAEYEGNVIHNITHFMDMDFISIGDNRITGEEVIQGDPADDGMYVKAVIRDHRLAGVNIVDNFKIGGVIRNFFIRRMEGDSGDVPDLQRGLLIREGLTEDFIRKLEELSHE